jgi:FkbM family methyltransferase
MAAFVARTARRNVRVVAKAAAEEAGTAQLWLPAGGRGTEGRASLTPQGTGRTIPVETIRLDSLDLADLGLIKIDVEGHELAALRGAAGLVERFRPTLVVELEDARASAAPILELLDSWDYAGSYLRDGVWRPLAGFDLGGHQRAMAHRLSGGYLGDVVSGVGGSYVNTVVFRPRKGRQPGA